MEKEDARTLTTEAQEQLRRQAIRLRQRGEPYKSIGEIVGVNQNTVWKWWQTYQAEGAKGLKSQKRGRREGAQHSLQASQE